MITGQGKENNVPGEGEERKGRKMNKGRKIRKGSKQEKTTVLRYMLTTKNIELLHYIKA